MREARRLYGKQQKIKDEKMQSCSFKSKIQRNLPNMRGTISLGPGSYEVSLPLVKPRFQAIRKNNNTIIIKVNERLSPVFQNAEPRFRSLDKHKEKVSKQNAEDIQTPSLIQHTDKSQILQQQRVNFGIKKRIQRLNSLLDIFADGEMQKEKQNNAFFNQFNNCSIGPESMNKLNLFRKQKQRLHFLLMNRKSRNKSKGFEWSKYRENKGNLYTINNVPGPGSYNYRYLEENKYQTIDSRKSWQFRSITKRLSQDKSQEKTFFQSKKSKFESLIDRQFYKVDSIPLLKH